jgi:protein-tyrosine phosphatase
MTDFIDTHIHILADLDDGPLTLEESIELAREVQANNISTVIATPHLNEGLFNFSAEKRDEEIIRLKKALLEEGIGIKVYPGAEVRITINIFDWLREEKLPTLANSQYLLLELPFDSLPIYTNELIFKLKTAGIVPILAHPERNAQIQINPSRLEKLINGGCLVQVNTSSLTGELGSLCYETAIEFLKRGWINILASDAHEARVRGPNFKEALEIAAKYIGIERATELVTKNPAQILNKINPA